MPLQIGPSPLEAFQIGTQLRGPSALGQVAMALTQRAMQMSQFREEARFKGEEEFKLQERLLPLKTEAARSLIQEKAKAQPFKPLSGEGAAKFTLASVGEKAAETVSSILFPGGTAEAYRGGLASAAANPILRTFGVPGKSTKGEAQRVYNNLKRAYKNKLRIESGAAIPEQELEREAEENVANFLSDPEAAFENLNVLKTFLGGVRATMDPSGAYGGLVNPTDFQQPTESGLQLGPDGLPLDAEVLGYLD